MKKKRRKNRNIHKSSLTCKKRTVLFRKSTNPKSAPGVVVRFRVYRNKLKKNVALKKTFSPPKKKPVQNLIQFVKI